MCHGNLIADYEEQNDIWNCKNEKHTVQKDQIIVVANRTFKTWQSSLNKSLYLLYCFTLKMCTTVMILEF